MQPTEEIKVVKEDNEDDTLEDDSEIENENLKEITKEISEIRRNEKN
jgi:hypothetical protein